MLYLFYGPDQFRIRKKVHQIRDKFIQKFGDISIEIIDGEICNFSKIDSAIRSLGFFNPARLIIIKNILKNPKKDILEKINNLLNKISSDIIVIFWEAEKIDSRQTLIKKIKKIGEVFEFKIITGVKLYNWIRMQVLENGGKIESKAVIALAEIIGPDLWQMYNEIEKLINMAGKKEINKKDVDEQVTGKVNVSIFNLIDNIGHKDCKNATKALYLLYQDGASELYVLSMIVYQFRNMLIIQDLSQNYNPFYYIVQKTGLHPYVVKKILSQVKNFSQKMLKSIYSKLQDAEFAIKTGKIEARVALDILVVGLCQ